VTARFSRIGQIALSVADIEESIRFYRDVIGLQYATRTDTFKGERPEKIQGIPGVASLTAWFVDDRDLLQLELFQFLSPRTMAFASDRNPRDVGYTRIAFEVDEVASFRDHCLINRADKVSQLYDIDGRPGFTLRDPDGILIEIEAAKVPLPDHLKARHSGIALTVPDLDEALHNFRDTLGFSAMAQAAADKGVLWREENADKRMVLLDGITMWIEISCYTKPGSLPWPDGYRISDRGILNIAIAYRDNDSVRRMYRRTVATGYRPNCAPECIPACGGVTYVNDSQGFSVEIMSCYRWLDGVFGFRPASRWDRLLAALFAKLA